MLRPGDFGRDVSLILIIFPPVPLEATSVFTVKGFLCPIVDRKRHVLLYFTLCCAIVKFSQCAWTARYFSSMICDLRLAGIPRVLVHRAFGRGPVAPPTSCVQTLKKQ